MIFCAIVIFSLTVASFPLAKSDESRQLCMNYYFSPPKIVRGIEHDHIEMNGCPLYDFNGIKLPATPLHILLPYTSEIECIEVRGFDKVSQEYNLFQENLYQILSPQYIQFLMRKEEGYAMVLLAILFH